jgi:hypothetical protein
MWQQVMADNPPLVQKAYGTLQANNSSWTDIGQFLAWLQDGGLAYYYRGPYYELVLCFRNFVAEGEWRAVAVGLRGMFSQDVITLYVQQAIDFMHQQNTKTLYALADKRSESDPIEQMYRAVFEVARTNPQVSEITEVDMGNLVRWTIVLK